MGDGFCFWALCSHVGCSGASSELKQEYALIDKRVNSDNATYAMDHFTPDFTLTLNSSLKPGETFILDSQETFEDEHGFVTPDATVMRRHDFQVRINKAAFQGDQFSTDVESVKMNGDAATVTFTRTQRHRGISNNWIMVRYKGHDEWKKQADGWRLVTEHLDEVKLGER